MGEIFTPQKKFKEKNHTTRQRGTEKIKAKLNLTKLKAQTELHITQENI